MANRFEKEAIGTTYGLDMLQNHCTMLNNLKWVRASGRPYFIAVKEGENGQRHHFIDRQA